VDTHVFGILTKVAARVTSRRALSERIWGIRVIRIRMAIVQVFRDGLTSRRLCATAKLVIQVSSATRNVAVHDAAIRENMGEGACRTGLAVAFSEVFAGKRLRSGTRNSRQWCDLGIREPMNWWRRELEGT
jgi:hypothetical protein